MKLLVIVLVVVVASFPKIQGDDFEIPPLSMRFAVDPPRPHHQQYPMMTGFAVINPGPQGFETIQQIGQPRIPVLGSACAENITCLQAPNSHCIEGTCQCLPSFVEDPIMIGICRLAPGYSEMCLQADLQCREPFVCNATNMCDCPSGYIQEYFQCVRNCPAGEIPVKGECHEAKQLGSDCNVNEQCIQSYAQCLHGTCQCIAGANQLSGTCYPVTQCPLGDPATGGRGEVVECKADSKEECPKDHYCLYAEFTDAKGFCCPKIKMNCPIGKPLDNRNCSDCPWETHHCFSYVIGSYTETMCCPNACPTSQPIQKDGQCFARAAFGGNCMIDEQCYNVGSAVCRPDESGQKQCLCPEGNYQNYFGKCLMQSSLGGQCTQNEECKAGTNTVCTEGVCSCYLGYMPEPIKTVEQAEKCIAEPSCPTATGINAIDGTYVECSDNEEICDATEFCRKWWFDGNRTYSLCCPKPSVRDYQGICEPFLMTLILANDILPLSADDGEPLHCDITPFPPTFLNDASVDGNSTIPAVRFCPAGSSCLFNPFSVNGGVCCKPPENPEEKAPKPAELGGDGNKPAGGHKALGNVLGGTE